MTNTQDNTAPTLGASLRANLEPPTGGINTHYAVVVFSGDLGGEHPDSELNGRSPHLELIACGPEEFCWDAVVKWTASHPLKMWQEVEVLARHPTAT